MNKAKSTFKSWIGKYWFHTVSWILIGLIIFYTSPLVGPVEWVRSIDMLCVIEYVILYYFTSLYLLPMLKNKQVIKGGLILFVIITVFVGHIYLIWTELFPLVGITDLRGLVEGEKLVVNIVVNFLIIFYAGVGYFFQGESKRKMKQNLELEKMKLDAEKKRLSAENERIELEKALTAKERMLLKKQWNEHATYNFFNSLYYRVYEKVPEAGEAIVLYSDFLEYSLRQKPGQNSLLKNEIEHIETYIKIEKILKKGVSVEFNHHGSVHEVYIAPLSLYSFVENAFKHGVVNDPRNPIVIEVSVENQVINFSVVNRKRKSKRRVRSSKVGHDNLVKMLELSYPNQHKLTIEEDQETYTAKLTIILDNALATSLKKDTSDQTHSTHDKLHIN
jgi:two-component system, LytTR family, sensor kinase